MRIYAGEVWSQFIVSCLAMGYDYEMIRKTFEERFGRADVTDEMIARISRECAQEIELEKQRQVDEVFSLSIPARIDQQARQLEELANDAHGKKDVKAMIAAAQALSKYLEMLAKISGDLKERKEISVMQKVSMDVTLSVFERMESDGLIRISDKEKLKRMIEVK